MRMNLKLFRVSQKLSQDEMARKVGMSRTHYCNVENGKSDPHTKFWESLQSAFDLTDQKKGELMRNEE